MAWPILIEVGILAVGGVCSLFDWFNAQSMDESSSQMKAYMDLLSHQTTLFDFVGQAWPSLLFILGVLLLGFTISTPQRKHNRRYH